QDLATRLTGAGHDVVVITPTPGASNVDGVRVHRIEAPLAPVFRFLTTAGGVRLIGEALAAERADVVHCHVSIVSPAAMGGALQAERRQIPTVITFHSVVPRTDLVAHAVNATLSSGTWRVKYTAVSERVARDVRPVAGAQTMTVLRNGVDVGAWRVDPIARPSGPVELISVMRLNAKKRPFALVDLMRTLRERPASVDVRLRMVGDGPLRTSLERVIRRHYLHDRIQLLGARSRYDIRALFAESDVFVLPTVRESFGLAALEARCAGLSVVAMRASGVSELIEHGREGLLAGSDAELTQHVRTLVDRPDLRAAIANHNRSTAPACDWSQVLDAHLALYREAIALRESV
ncbi:MAG TPA: glycosyltransferase family 4 protein, partial [Gemmatimonadaceae bacterium]